VKYVYSVDQILSLCIEHARMLDQPFVAVIKKHCEICNQTLKEKRMIKKMDTMAGCYTGNECRKDLCINCTALSYAEDLRTDFIQSFDHYTDLVNSIDNRIEYTTQEQDETFETVKELLGKITELMTDVEIY